MGREVKFVLYDPSSGISLSQWNALGPALLVILESIFKTVYLCTRLLQEVSDIYQ